MPRRSAHRSTRGSIPTLITLLTINGWLLAWRILMRAVFTASAYGWREGLLSIPRLVVGNVIAMLAAARAVSLHLGGGARRWDKTRHIFPARAAAVRPSLRFLALAVFGWAGVRAATLGVLPGPSSFASSAAKRRPPPIVPTEFPPIEPVAPAAPGYAATNALPPRFTCPRSDPLGVRSVRPSFTTCRRNRSARGDTPRSSPSLPVARRTVPAALPTCRPADAPGERTAHSRARL